MDASRDKGVFDRLGCRDERQVGLLYNFKQINRSLHIRLFVPQKKLRARQGTSGSAAGWGTSRWPRMITQQDQGSFGSEKQELLG